MMERLQFAEMSPSLLDHGVAADRYQAGSLRSRQDAGFAGRRFRSLSTTDRRPLQSWGFEVTMAETGAEAWHILEQPRAPKLVLLDWVLPDIEGIELCQRIRAAGSSGQYVYIILLNRAKKAGKTCSMRCRPGRDDYLMKPFDESELKARLLAGKRILDLQEELVAARESMREAATRDFLTGLLNRAEIFDLLERELERSRREHKPLSVILGRHRPFQEGERYRRASFWR